ncbi:MAG: efflux RND transporter permease subunit, partial [Candidatus Eiseniibacteriota bacterium]
MTRLFAAVHAQRRAIVVLFCGVIVMGVYAAFRLPASILPEVTFPRITVLAEAGELPSEAMMRAVTRPLEEAVRGVPGVGEVRSTTSRGSAEITLDGPWRSDMNLMLQRVQARIESERPNLPAGTTLDARLMNPALFPVVGFSLTSDGVSPAKLRDAAIMILKPELSRLPGVAEVIVQGGRRLEARVALDPSALQARGLDAPGVAEVIRKSTTLESVGLLEANAQLYLALSDGRPADLAGLESLPIPTRSGPPVLLGQLGRIELSEAPEFTRYRARSREAVLVNLLRQPTASAVILSNAAHHWFNENRGRLPAGVTVETFYDQADLVRASADGVRDSLLVGTLLAVLIVILFLGSVRLGLAGALVLPGSIAMTLITLAFAHQSLNMMTLGGVAAAVGLVLDDAIVVVDYLAARLEESPNTSRWDATSEIAPTLFGSSLCTLAIFLPFVSLGGVTGAFFRVLSLSMALMLVASLILCLTLVPLLSPVGLLGAGKTRERKSRLDTAFRFATSRPWIAWAAAAGLIAGAILLHRGLGTGFLPEMDEGSLILDYVAPPGTALTVTDRMLQDVEKEIDATPEIASWSRRTGDQLGFFITEPNIGDYVLRLARKRQRTGEEVADDLRSRIAARQPALVIEFGQLVEDVIGDLIATPQPIEVRVFHEDRGVAEAKAREVAAIIQDVPGVVDVNPGIVVSGPTLRVVPGPASSRAGLNAEDLARAAEPALTGIPVGDIVRGIRAWPVRVT